MIWSRSLISVYFRSLNLIIMSSSGSIRSRSNGSSTRICNVSISGSGDRIFTSSRVRSCGPFPSGGGCSRI